MLTAKDFRAKARAALKGKWIQAVIAGLIAGLLGGSIAYSSGGSAASTTSNAAPEGAGFLSPEGLIAAIIAVVIIILVVAALTILVGSIVGLGYAKFNLELYEKDTADFKVIFSERARYKDCFKLYLLQTVYILVGSLLFIVPGIIASFAYMLGAYVMYENPEMTAKEALKASKEMMKGNKWRLFCLQLSFIGWDILGVLTLGIGSLFVRPYVETAVAAFYNDVKPAK